MQTPFIPQQVKNHWFGRDQETMSPPRASATTSPSLVHLCRLWPPLDRCGDPGWPGDEFSDPDVHRFQTVRGSNAKMGWHQPHMDNSWILVTHRLQVSFWWILCGRSPHSFCSVDLGGSKLGTKLAPLYVWSFCDNLMTHRTPSVIYHIYNL